MRFRLSLAQDLGMTLAGVDQLSLEELGVWQAYFQWRARQRNQ